MAEDNTLSDVARSLGITDRQLRGMVNRGEVDCIRYSARVVMFTDAQVAKIRADHEVKASPAAAPHELQAAQRGRRSA